MGLQLIGGSGGGGGGASATTVAAHDAAVGYTGTVKGAWAGNTVYAVGDVVTTEAGLFRATTAHTANAAGFRYDRNYWETVPLPALAAGTSVPVRQLDTTNFGTGLTTPRAGIFQKPVKQFNYQGERVIWAFKAASDVTTSGTGITTAAGSAPGGSIVTTRNSGTSTMVVTATLAGTVDLSGNVHVRIPAKINQAVQASMYLTFFLSSTDTSGNNALKVDVVAADPPAYGWRTYSIPLADITTVGTGANLAAIKYFRMEVTGVATDSVELGRITYLTNAASKGKVMLWFDDGGLGNQAAAIDVAARYGLPVTLAGMAAQYTAAGVTITTDKARYIQDILGGQIAVHAFGSSDHDRTQDGAALLEQMLDYQHFGLATGLNGVMDGAYYNTGYPSPDTAERENIARKMFRSARATGARYVETMPPGDPLRTRAFSPPANSTSTGYYQLIANRAVANKGLAQFLWHAMTSTDLTEFTTFCAWLDANRATVDVVTPMRAYDPLCV